MKYPFYRSIKGKFLIIIVILVLVLGVGTTTFSYISYSNKLRDNSLHAIESNLQFLSDRLNEELKNIQNHLKWCQTNAEMVRFVMTPYNSEDYASIASNSKLRLDEELQYNSSNSYIQRTVIANLNQDNYLQCVSAYFSTDRDVVDTIIQLPYFEDGMNQTQFSLDIGFQTVPFSRSHAQAIPVLLPIYHTYQIDKIGFVYIEISPSLFTDIFSQYTKQENSPIYLTLGDNIYQIQSDEIQPAPEDYKTVKSQLTASISPTTFVNSIRKDHLVSYPLSLEGCYISQQLPTNLFYQQFSSYLVQVAVIFLAIIIIGILLYLLLIRTFNRPVQSLNERLGKISMGDFSIDKQIEWNNEFGDIGRNINFLANDIHELMDHRIAHEKEKKDYEYKMLQSQINPHFLYNTLNSIKWMAITQNAPGIAEMVTSLSRLLKNIAKGSSTIVSVEDELKLLDDYFLIQKYRYGGTIVMEKTLQNEHLVANQIPRFTLQPIIENAIFHGIEPKGTNGCIQIYIYQNENQDVCIAITDNGVGMQPEQVEKLLSENTSNRTSFFKDVGVSSVHKRLQYCFGEQYGLKITSIPGKSTTVTICLKNTLNKGEEI